MNQAKVVKIWALEGLKGMSLEDLRSVVKQTMDNPDCSETVVLLDVRELWHVGDLKSEHALALLHQRINK